MPTVTNFSRYLSSSMDLARQTESVMPKRPLGHSGLCVGAVGLGTSALEAGNFSAVPDAEACSIIESALDMQASVVDVAYSGGEDRALNLLGRAIEGRRRQATICLRVAGGPDDLQRGLERALGILGTDHVDLLLWDRPDRDELKNRDSAWAALALAKRQGKILCAGAALEGPEELRLAVRSTPAEALRFPLNVFDQGNAAVLDEATAKGLGLIAVRPLDSGWLSGRYGARHLFLDARRRWSGEDKARRAELQKAFEELAVAPGSTAAQAALCFALSFPVSCVVASVSAWQQVVGNVDATRLTLDAAALAGLKSMWQEHLA
ncbi:MAG: aldo/keto reductase, partial [bacterium]